MKGVCTFLVVLGIFFNFVQAKPVMVAVELNNQDQIRFWRSHNYPTYEFIENTAIAEIDDAQIPILKKQGLHCLVIDELPWIENYYIVMLLTDASPLLPGKTIWQKDAIHLIKLPEKKVIDLFKHDLKFQPLHRRILPERFWEQMLAKTLLIAVDYDPFIQNIVDQVNTDSLTAYIQRLQDFKTRLILTDSSYAASEWLRQKFNTWGYTAQFDSFWVSTSWPGSGYERNVIAASTGTLVPSRTFIICGHFDAIVWTDTIIARYYAPGADDNATGTVTALEAARIFRNYSWESTMEFIGWAAEELGLFGSYHYARRADSLGLDIGGVVNSDMIGYMDDANLDVIIQRRSLAPTWFQELFDLAGQLYVPSLIIYPVTSGGGSDWYPFAVYGYPSVGAAERAGSHWNPYYHDTTDLITTLTPELYTKTTKTVIATFAILGLYPGIVKDVAVQDMGDGDRLAVNWSANSESDVVGYNVYSGMTSGVYADTHFVSGINSTTDTLTGLMTDSTYYIAVTAIDGDDRESYAATEVTGIPRDIPYAPEGVVATPIVSGIRIDWQPNQELDLAGYRVYQRINEDPEYDSMNIILLQDTTFTNAPLSGENKYYYAVRAFDDDGNPSPMSEEAYGRPITLDQGIIIVDETRNSTNPPDSLQDEFYQYIMDGYEFDEYEYGSSAEKPILADFVPYSTILWHADDFNQLMADDNAEDLKTYLDLGGKLWFVGWKPTANLKGNPAYPADFVPGDFIYDYFKISHAEIALNDSFQAAIGLLDYPDLDVDPAKVPNPGWGGTMRMIEALTSVSPGEDIYTIDMKNNSSPFEGEVCGIRYLGADYKTCFFGFPLYFMDQEQARAVALKVMSDFGEPGVAERPDESLVITECRLDPNMPNPCRGILRIQFHSPDDRNVTIRLFDVVGRQISKVFDGKAKMGVNEVLVMPNDLSMGIYFIQLETREHKETRKVIYLE